ncbi:MAG: L-dopachrome tautomerase-related protein [Reyranella sp.]|uniref:L-dopachrome tautomerase-related protein n=1 Tax=Reyranella sp. TaxID=1929291 RepID=UPI003D0A67CF
MPTCPKALWPFFLVTLLPVACLCFASSTAAVAQNGPSDRDNAVNIALKADDRLKPVATFDQQVTGVTVSQTGRIFVSFPRWTEDVEVSVAEVQRDGSIKPYPNEIWNSWRKDRKDDLRASTHFVAVQSVVADGGSLWVLDPAAPNAEKIVKNGPKIVQIDLVTNTVKRAYLVPPDVAGPTSYLNDIRIAPDGKYAYVTDSGVPGGLVVLEIGSGKSWRALSDAPPTKADPRVTITTDGQQLRRPDGQKPAFNADGIALSPDGAFLYWQALTGKTLYRIETGVLKTPSPQGIEDRVEKVAETEPVDGLWMDKSGRLYLSSLADNAVKALEPDGKRRTVIADPRLRWPDTIAEGPDGTLYVTASRIQDSPWFHRSGWQGNGGFTLFSFRPDAEPGSK